VGAPGGAGGSPAGAASAGLPDAGHAAGPDAASSGAPPADPQAATVALSAAHAADQAPGHGFGESAGQPPPQQQPPAGSSIGDAGAGGGGREAGRQFAAAWADTIGAGLADSDDGAMAPTVPPVRWLRAGLDITA
jgi:hypothetical protein